MAGILHLFDHNSGKMTKKHKNYIGDVAGFEAPRNSLESPAESLQSFYTAGESEPNSHEASRSTSKSSSYSTDTSMKKFINDAMSKGSNYKQHAPSIVARLMGMDARPSGKELFVQPLEKEELFVQTLEKTDSIERDDDAQKQSTKKLFYKKKSKSSGDRDLKITRKNAYFRLWSSSSKLGKPHGRVHPQEKELQQFKKDFEAWQAARFLECARVVQLGNIPEQWIAQLGLTKEKMAVYENARQSAIESTKTLKSNIAKAKNPSGNGRDVRYNASKKDLAVTHMNLHQVKKQNVDKDLDELSMADTDQKSEKSSAHSRIVILKPGPESFSSNDESWVSSSSSVDDRDCIEDLLEEVKERLKCELHGKTFSKGSMVRGGGIETPFKEKPLPPNQKLCDIRTPVRENTTEDLGRRLLRSESSISYSSEIHPIGLNSPELISRNTRDILSERLGNALHGENHHEVPSNCSSRSIMFDDTRERLQEAKNILNARIGWNSWNDGNYGPEAQTRSFRYEFAHEGKSYCDSSPRSLMRSLSAPASRVSFGKLLLEDRHMLNETRIRRKHESPENNGMDGKSMKRDKFNIREKVSNIKHNFTLRGKLFRRKLRSVDASQNREYDLTKDVAGPTDMMNFNDRNDNYTEVPPSPASICSSAHEEFWKPIDHPSPISTSDITSVGDQSVGNVFREISSNLHELRRQLNQLDYEGSEVTTVTDEPVEAEVLYLEDESETYIKDLLVASGLYDGSSDKYPLRWDPFVKHIGDWVFEKVEEEYSKTYYENEQMEEVALYHKLLFHLLNEALCIVFRPPMNLTRFSRRIISPPILPPLHGRKLLEKVWEIICDVIYPSPDKAYESLDDIMSHDLDFMPWFNIIDVEENKLVGRELEARITTELIEEVVKDMQASYGVNKHSL
ncbi:hypothetical protein V2J09_009820 [Rumex salicifolius]